MVHAFNIVTLFEKCAYHIESVESWESKGASQLLVGTAEGLILRYSIHDHAGKISATQIDAIRMSKKPLTQLSLIEEHNKLIALSDYVSLYELPDFRLRCQLSKTKDCHLYAIDRTRRNLLLAAAVRKKVIIYELDASGNFVEKKELALVDQVKCMVWCGNDLCVGFKKDYAIINVTTGVVTELFPTGKAGPPIASVLPNEQVLLELDNISIFIGFDGKPTKKYGLTWSEPPIALSYSFPYVIAILGKFLEVRAVFGSQKMVQSIPLRGLKAITHKKEIFVATTQTVWHLVPVPLLEQIGKLENDRKYKQALNLAENIPFPTEEAKKEKIRSIKIARAFKQFAKRRFDRALELFYELNFDPFKVIGLYPDLLPKAIRQTINYPFSMPDLEGAVLESALQELINYLAQKRIHCVPDPKLRHDDYSQTRDLAEIIDTALLKAYLRTNDALVAPLLRLPNHCHVRECEIVLQVNKKYIELVLLYKSKGLHQAALDLLCRMGQTPKGTNVLSGPQETIRYLKALGAQHLDLILHFSKWVMNTAPEESLAIFTEERAPEDQLPPAKIFEHIKAHAPRIAVAYLEYLIFERGDKTPQFHDELVHMYLTTVMTLKAESYTSKERTNVPAGFEPGLLGKVRRKLLDFLDSSKFYQPEKMLKLFPADDLFEERAIMLSSLGKHDRALAIYAYNLRDFRLAEEYCDKHYKPSGEDEEVYLALLRLYLTSQEPMLQPALRLLNKHFARINAAKALDLLMPTIPLQDLMLYLEAVLRENTKNRRNNQVVKNLLKTESHQVRFQHMKARSRAVKIYEGRLCPVCNKRLGTSVFACYPNGVVVHFICFKDKSVCPVTGTRFQSEKPAATVPSS